MIDIVAEQEATRRFLHEHAVYVHPPSFVDGAEWYAAGMAVCAFLEDLSWIMKNNRMCIKCCGDQIEWDANLGRSVICRTCGGNGTRMVEPLVVLP